MFNIHELYAIDLHHSDFLIFRVLRIKNYKKQL